MNIIKKILSALLNIVLVLLAVVIATVMVKNVTGSDPTVLGFRVFYIVTGSMEPTIPVGAAVLVRAQDPNSYEPGDVITFKASQQQIAGQPNTHRIIEKYVENGTAVYVTQGDANPVPDTEPVYGPNIIGKVVWTSGSARWLGTLMGLITTPMGFFACIIMPIMAIIAFSIKDFSREYKAVMAQEAKQKLEEEQQKQEEEQKQAEEQAAAEQAEQYAQFMQFLKMQEAADKAAAAGETAPPGAAAPQEVPEEKAEQKPEENPEKKQET